MLASVAKQGDTPSHVSERMSAGMWQMTYSGYRAATRVCTATRAGGGVSSSACTHQHSTQLEGNQQL
jgi:hypothetical protein